MALKPNTIKALFGNLKMDSLDPVLKSQILQDTAEDTTRLLKYMDSKAQYGQYPYHRFQSNPAVRNALQSKTGYVGNIPVVRSPAGGVMNNAVEFIRANDIPYSDVNTHELYRALDNATDAAPENPRYYADQIDYFLNTPYSPHYDGDVPGFVTEEIFEGYPDDLYATFRPHKNEALSRWFEKAKHDKGNAIEMSRWNVPKDLGSEEFDDLPF